MSILSLIVLALIGESVWENAKMLWQNGKLNFDRVGALAIGLLLALGARVDLLEMVGIHLYIPWLGIVLTGLLISRGANFMHDLLTSISNIQNNTKTLPKTIEPVNIVNNMK